MTGPGEVGAAPGGGAVATALCWPTVANASLPDMVAAASAAGFDAVAVTPRQYFAALEDGWSQGRLRSLLAEAGVGVANVDPLITSLPASVRAEDLPDRYRHIVDHGEHDCFAVAEALGCRVVNVAHYLGGPVGIAELTDAFGGICDRSAGRGLEVTLEFMPEGAVVDLATAQAIVEGAGRPNGGIMFDTFHFFRAGGELAEALALPLGLVRAMQVSDGPEPSPDGDTAGGGRLLPGEGSRPLAELIEALAADPAVVVGVEVISRELARLDPTEAARRAREGLRAVLAR